MKLFKLPIMLGVLLFCSSQLLWAEEPLDETEQLRRLPKEAYKACEGKAAGVAASFTTAATFTDHQGETINGLCQVDHEGKLVVRRERPQN